MDVWTARAKDSGRDLYLLSRWPAWTGYAATLLLEVLLTAGLLAIHSYFPLGNLPFVYIILIMAVAYLFGEGPALLSFVIGLVLYDRFFIVPNSVVSGGLDMTEWTRLTAFLLGTSTVGFAALLMRRSNRRIARLASELEQQRALLDAFTKNVPVGLALHDRSTKHIIINEALAQMGGKSMEETIGKTVWEVLPKALATDVAAAIEEVFTTGKPSTKHSYLAPVGEGRYFDILHHPVRVRDKIVGVGAVVVDITELVMAQNELQRNYDREHRIADILQASLLGEVSANIAGFEFETLYRAAMDEARIGGDFYDAFRVDEGKIAVEIGDVSGKGLSAAVQVAMAKCNLRGRLYDSESPALALEQVNSTLARDRSADGFVTMCVGILDCESRTFTYANGGHAPVIYWDAARKEARLLNPTGPLLGMESGWTYGEERIQLEPGDEILLATDGLFEIRCTTGMMDINDLLHVYSRLRSEREVSASELVDCVQSVCGGELRDDVAILRVRLAK